MASAEISGVIMRSRSPVSTRLSRALRSTAAGVVAAVAKHMVGAGMAVRIGSAVRPQSAFVCLESPNRGGVRPSRPKPRSGGATASAFTA